MLIANPIYDAVFKFLMEDLDIVKDLLSLILGEEIETFEAKPQETAAFVPSIGIGILRYDFKAIIKTQTGERKKVLIELQKAKHMLDIMRFRRYLGENYTKPDDFQEDGITKSEPVDIVTVYFLGFKLENVPYPVLKSANSYQDVLNGTVIEGQMKEPFVNLLDHEAYFIQIPRLEANLQTRLEKVLLVFSQKNRTDGHHELDFKGNTDDSLINRMVKRLKFAIADEEVQKQIIVEEEVESIFLKMDRKIELANQKLEHQSKSLEEKDKKLEEKDKKLEALQKKLLALGLDPNILN